LVDAVCDLFPGTVCGDPRFTGGDGNIFYFHGHKDGDFCLLSDPNLHINTHFIGKHNPSLNRDFTWIQALGILFGKNHRFHIGVEKTVTWNDESDRLIITFDGEPIYIPEEVNARWVSSSEPALSITRSAAANGVILELNGVFTIMANAVPITEEESRIHNYGVGSDDSLAHLDLSFKFYSLSDTVDGVLGQTYRPDYVNKLDVTKKMPVMGGAPRFVSSGIFSTDCKVAQFGSGGNAGIAMVTESA
jgi:Root cap